MLTSFFSKSRPITFVLVAVYMMSFYMIANFTALFNTSMPSFLTEAGIFILLLLSVFLLNFISKRNELTSRNSYKSIFFAVFACLFLASLENNDVVIANFFVLLSLRRIISLRNQRHSVQKIFDATFWICVASLFYFWSIIFLLLVYFGVLVHEGYRFKSWLVPPIAFLALLSIVTSVHLYLKDRFYTFSDWFQRSDFDFSAYREPEILIPLALLLAITLWTSFYYLGVIQKSSASNKTPLFMVLFFLFLSITVAIFAPTKDSSELMFFFAPLALIVTNYFQVSEDKWFREAILWILLLLSVALQVFF